MSSGWLGAAGARAFGEEERDAVLRVFERRTLYRGGGLEPAREVPLGERELASALGRRFALLVSSGTAALLAALVALKLRPGDEVIVPGYGWLSDLSVVLHLGLVPVLAPLRPDLTIDPAHVPDCASERTRALVAIHACGGPYAAAELEDVARRTGLHVVEGACQGLGSRVHGRPAGALAPVSALSFQAFKLVTSGEGGALLTDDPAVYEAALRFHDAGLSRFAGCGAEALAATLEPAGVGLNLRMSELSAALVRVQLRRVPDLIGHLHAARDRLVDALSEPLTNGALRRVPLARHARDNGTFLMLRAAAPGVARLFRNCWAQHGCQARLASEARLHALPGWLDFLRREGRPHRVIGLDQTLDTLARTLLLEVNWQLDDAALDALTAGTRLALSRL
jgi:dTDP-4-amino-4,6-dideoxygalactose transaminase